MHAAALLLGLRVHLRERLPETQRTIARRHLRSDRQTALLEVQQELVPRLLALPLAILDRHQLLLAFRRRPYDHQDAGASFFETNVEMDAVGPEVNVALVLERPLAPLLIVFLPSLLEPHDRGR